jgi:hypothetical protein
MIADSNFYVLNSSHISKREQSKRIKHLENTLAQLKAYHKVARPLKRVVILRLIAKYELFIQTIKEL